MSEAMKQQFGLIKRPWGVFYLKNKRTGEQAASRRATRTKRNGSSRRATTPRANPISTWR
jgi:hypothetical protein